MSRRIAVAQMSCTSSVEENLRQATDLIAQARLTNASFVCLPESFDYVVDDPTYEVSLASTINMNAILQRYHALSTQSNLWLSLGGMHILSNEDPSRIYKTHFILSPNDPTTPIVAYNKIHLDFNNKVAEIQNTIPGNKLVVAYDTPIGNVGLSIGSDLYYPTLFQSLNQANINMVLNPCSFSMNQSSHYQTLLKSRAVENQCYFAAANQVGSHSYSKESCGQSMIINPIGECVADAGRMGPGLIYADLDLDLVYQVRERIPLRKFKREDIFGKVPRPGSM